LKSALRISSKPPPASTLANAEGKDPAEVLNPEKNEEDRQPKEEEADRSGSGFGLAWAGRQSGIIWLE
jgi:ribosomal protein L12E/L44/L45/RPP1/RPP2